MQLMVDCLFVLQCVLLLHAEMVECEGCGVWAHTACLVRYGRYARAAWLAGQVTCSTAEAAAPFAVVLARLICLVVTSGPACFHM